MITPIKNIISKTKYSVYCGVLFLLPFISFSGFSQTEIGVPYIKNYTHIEYNAHTQNFAISQDGRGIMYFANFSGVLEFDGQSWRTILTKGMSQITALATDKNSTVYVGARGEVGYLKPDKKGNLIFISLTDSLNTQEKSFKRVINIFPTESGVYYICDNSILLWDGVGITSIPVTDPIKSSFYVNDRIYFNMDIGIGILEDMQLKMNTQNYISKAVEIKAMIPYRSDSILIGTNVNGLLIMDKEGIISEFDTETNRYFINNIISCGIKLSDNSFAFGTDRGGVVLLNPDCSLKQIINQGLQDNDVNAIFVNDEDVLWLALDNGISRIQTPSALSFFDLNSGIEGGVNKIIRIKDIVYFATNVGLYYAQDGSDIIKLVNNIKSACWSLIADGESLIAATSTGVFLIKDGQPGLVCDGFSLTLYRSKRDTSIVYVGQTKGIKILQEKNDQWALADINLKITDEISEIREDENDNIWLGTSTMGLIKILPDYTVVPEYYNAKKGLPSEFGNHLNELNNKLYVGTMNGLFAFSQSADSFYQIKSFANDTLIPKEWISEIEEDMNGNFWSTRGDQKRIKYRNSKGIEEASVQSLLKPIQNTTISTIYIENNEKVWLGGPEGIIRFNPLFKKSPKTKSTALIRRVQLRRDSVLFEGTYYDDTNHISIRQPQVLIPELNHKENTLIFEFTYPSFYMNEKVQFQYMLEGFDDGFTAWSAENFKEYSNLRPGKYTFKVKAQNIYENITETASYQFSIKKPYYKTLVAFLLYALIVAAVIYAIVRWRSLKLIKEKKRLEDLIQTRTAEVVSQKDEIEKQSLELSNKNNELEKINLIVKSINSEIDSSSLYQSILERTKVIGGVQKASLLVPDKNTDTFGFKAGYGWNISIANMIELKLNDINEIYLSNAEEVFEDIFSVKKLDFHDNEQLAKKLEVPQSMLIMVLRINNLIEGFLILENTYKKEVFKAHDFSLLYNLKEHIISAFIKTKILEDLQNTLENLKNTQQQLIEQEKMASIGQLTKGIVDRILNPLNYINNFSRLTNNLTVEIKETLQEIEEKIEKDKFEDLLDVTEIIQSNVLKINEHGNSASRIVKGMEKLLQKKSTKLLPTDINTLIENNIQIALQEYKSENKEYEVDIITEFDKNSEKVLVLPTELGSVFTNLLSNAFYSTDEKAKKQADYKPQIQAKTHFQEQFVEIRITDNGHGISNAEQQKLFSPFFTTKPTSKGTGLGLYMSADILKRHKGTINIESVEGQYVTFIIRIPLLIENDNNNEPSSK